ncbi:thiamine pyrophosphate-binding protein [Candidatus Avelusimicrobium aviculae]|uniref:thiamine pyrophosphate-binding protein n=1 Tax=Candidatus Avelusimicrobium aviculae TaxID=3416206 RepID=UPI003D126967
MIKTSDYLVQKLETLGVDTVFMVSGGGAMHLDDSFGRSQKIRLICNHNEQASSMCAEGYARANQKLAVACVTTGPGGLNCLNGVFGAWTDSAPVLFISGQVKYTTTTASCPQVSLRQLGDQEVDIISVVRPLTKYARMVTDPYDIDAALEEAVYFAVSGRPGPVWLDIPLNVQAALINPSQLKKFAVSAAGNKDISAALAQAAHLLQNAKRPLLVAGNGIHCAKAQKALRAFLDKTHIPVTTTFNGFDLVASEDPLFAGRIGTVGQRAGNFVLQNADVILFAGTRNNIRQVSYNWENFAKNAKKIVVDIDPAELQKPTVHPDVALCADVGQVLSSLTEQLTGPLAVEPWREYCRQMKAKYPPLREFSIQGQDKVHPYLFMQRLSRILPENARVVASNGTACVAFFQAFESKEGQRLLLNSGDASMGYGLPAAIGVCAAEKNAPVVCLEGDGSLMMNLQELQTLKTNQLPVKLFVIKNGEYISIIQTQRNFFEGRLTACNKDSGVEVPDFVKVAQAFGLPAVRIVKNDELADKIQEVLNTPGPVVCELECTENYTFAPKLSARKLEDASMVSPSLEDMFPFLEREELAENMSISRKEK